MTDALPFAPGDKVHKATGSYKHNGIVRAVYPLGDGSLRVTVEHDADVEGTFVHHYAPSALAAGWLPTREMAIREELSRAVLVALDKSVELQSHYAARLNSYDGGARLQFSSAQEWLDCRSPEVLER